MRVSGRLQAPPAKLYIPGEIGRKKFRFAASALKLLHCPSNTGAAEVAEALRAYVLARDSTDSPPGSSASL